MKRTDCIDDLGIHPKVRLSSLRSGPKRLGCRALNCPPISGFTMIEMIVALLLASMIALVATSVLRSLLQTQRTTDALFSATVSETLAEQLRRDIVNAEFYSPLPNGVLLSGSVASDPVTKISLLKPAIVRYLVLPDSETLVRIETATAFDPSGLTRVSNQTEYRDVVWFGAARLRVESSFFTSDFESTELGLEFIEPESGAETTSLLPMPSSLRIQIIHSNGQVLFDERILHGVELE